MHRKIALILAFILLLSARSSSSFQDNSTNGSQASVTEFPGADDPRNPSDNNSGIIQVELGIPFQLGIGQTGEILGVDTEITFMHVAAESRCPSDVQCIWAGQVVIAIEVKQGEEIMDDFELVLGTLIEEDESPSWEIDGLIIFLIDVSPYPKSDQTIEQKDYSAEFVVSMMEGPP